MDDAIREVHGCACRDNNAGQTPAKIEAREAGDLVVIKYDGHYGAVLTQWQARYLASKLYRLSRRIRARDMGA